MKKIAIIMMIMCLGLVSGCQKAADLLVEPTPEPTIPIVTHAPIENKEQHAEVNAIIPISQTLKMTNDWTILGDYSTRLTWREEDDRVVLGTSAETVDGKIMWDDSQYWTIAVLNEDGAYNLFSERMTGNVYMEIGEAFYNGITTPIVTAYIFSGADREIRNYTFNGESFDEVILYSTRQFSTGGVNSLYTTFPEYKSR